MFLHIAQESDLPFWYNKCAAWQWWVPYGVYPVIFTNTMRVACFECHTVHLLWHVRSWIKLSTPVVSWSVRYTHLEDVKGPPHVSLWESYQAVHAIRGHLDTGDGILMHHMIQWNPLHNNYVLSPRPSEDNPLIRTYFGGQSVFALERYPLYIGLQPYRGLSMSVVRMQKCDLVMSATM